MFDRAERKFDLMQEISCDLLMQALKANNILYDKDADGEYLQLYTQSFKELFFFEIVERRGYKGFGAINAPIRATRDAAPAAECPRPAGAGASRRSWRLLSRPCRAGTRRGRSRRSRRSG